MKSTTSIKNKIYLIYKELLKTYGNPRNLWPEWCAKKKNEQIRELIAIGAILTQRTSWRNADIALRNLKKNRLLSLSNIAALRDLNKITKLLRPAGFFQTKPRRLFEFATFIVKNYKTLSNFGKEKPTKAREKLLNVYGIGPETADTILLYALDKPSFVIDEYTRRFVAKRKLSTLESYSDLKRFFEKSLPKDVSVYQNFHVLIIVEQKGKKGSLMDIIGE